VLDAPPTRPGEPSGQTPRDGKRPTEPPAREPPLPERRSDARVAALFDEIAPAWDRLSWIVSFGRDRRWRAAAVRATGVGPGDSVVDVFAATGRMATALAERVGPFGRVVAVDLAPRMVERGTASARDLVQIQFVLADALALPFDDDRFDAATVSFGLRTLPDLRAGVAEMRRVVRPGGRVVCLERVFPRPRPWGRAYRGAVRRLVPVASLVAGRGRGEAYRRLADELDHVPEVGELTEAMRAAGLADVSHRPFWFGAVALVAGTVPLGS
jgi:demethylmenaquinone methyltransferase / 2-methoxy-6-polyprenyl-1,4-benzoquinol methylase